MSQVPVLLVGIKPEIRMSLVSVLLDLQVHRCDDKSGWKKLMNEGSTTDFKVVLCGDQISEMTVPEIGQTARMLYPKAKVFFVVDRADNFDKDLFLKNGFNEVFLLPFEENRLKTVIEKSISHAEEELYTPVHLVDIGPGTQLDFDLRIFLNRNDRFVTYAAAKDVLDESRLERLKIYKVQSVFVPVEHVEKFHEFSASRLAQLCDRNGSIPEAERQQMLNNSVRELIKGLLAESYSQKRGSEKKNFEHTQNIVQKFLTLTHPGDWHKKLMDELTSLGPTRAHAERVASFSVLFAMTLGQGDTQDLTTAAMFHDLGLAKLPDKFRTAAFETLTSEEQVLYKAHPEYSLKLLEAANKGLNSRAKAAISQHHERWDGSGFPKGLKGSLISIEGQILAVANRFDQLTRIESKQTPLSPDQAFRKISSEGIMAPELIQLLESALKNESFQNIA